MKKKIYPANVQAAESILNFEAALGNKNAITTRCRNFSLLPAGCGTDHLTIHASNSACVAWCTEHSACGVEDGYPGDIPDLRALSKSKCGWVDVFVWVNLCVEELSNEISKVLLLNLLTKCPEGLRMIPSSCKVNINKILRW